MAKKLKDFKNEHDPLRTGGDSPVVTFDRPLSRGAKCFIITSAQNATPVHAGFFDVLQTIARIRDAELIVIPLRYKNPTSRWLGSQEGAETWAKEVRPYLFSKRFDINKNLTVLADIKTQPTTVNPLAGFEPLSMASSGIIGHTKMHFRAVPTPSNKMAKIISTTGACTVANYSDTRIGAIGEFHHILSALIVEVDGAWFGMRQLHFDTKTSTVTDLNTRYSAAGASVAPRALALVTGDTHVDFIDPAVEKATYLEGGLVPLTQPQNLIYHDLFDGYSVNPHHFGNPFNKVAKRKSNHDYVRAEVERAIDFVKDSTPKNANAIIVGSNHDDFLTRWAMTNDWRLDPMNAEFCLETQLAMVRGAKMGKGGAEYPAAFPYWFEKAKVPQSRVLGNDESFVLGGVELSMHGHKGPNGSRGSIRNLRRLGVKSIIGHSHTPGIDEGCYQTGTSTRLRLEYNGGPSSWLNAHVLLNADGKRQLIVIVDGRYKL